MGRNEAYLGEKNPNEITNNKILQESSVYYEVTTGNAISVYVSGNYAYVADDESGLAVIDISDPTNPGTPFYEDTSGNAHDVYVSGDYAYIADGSSGLAVIDISDPTNPGTPVYEDTSGYSYGIYVSGDYAYIADGSSGLTVIDISDPTNPGTPIYEDTSGFAYDVYLSGDYAYIADCPSGLAIIDISDPTNPGIPIYEITSGFAYDVYVSGDYAYVADGESGLAVIDISDPTNPGIPIYEDTTGLADGIYIDGDHVYVAVQGSGLSVIDISDPMNPGTPIYEDTTGTAASVCVNGNHAYIADVSSGLAVIKVSEPINPETPVYEDTTGDARGVYVSGDFAYVADAASGLAVIDISDPTDPGTPIYENTVNSANGVYISGDYAYVADGFPGLAIIDISDPTNPGTPVYLDPVLGGVAVNVFISGDFAYVTSGDWIYTINISDPINPELCDNRPLGLPRAVYISGDYAFIADGSKLTVIDISDPTDLGIPIFEVTTAQAYDVFISGDYAYIADSTSGLAIIDISDPTNPGTPVYEDTAGFARGVFVSGDLAYVADGASGLAVIDISDPNDPGIPVYEDTSGQAYDVYVSGDYAYVADGESGLAVIKIRECLEKKVPIISDAPSDFSVEYEYTGQSLSWTAIDAHPNNYTIELIGTGIVVPSTSWVNNTQVLYNIPDGLSVGLYTYMITFTDEFGNFITDSINFTVEESANPIITKAPIDLSVELGYTGQSLSWTVTDLSPNIYTIELQGYGIVAGPTTWTSGTNITHNILNGLYLGTYVYTINLTDFHGNSVIDEVIFTVEDATYPVITISPNDITVDYGYTGQSISWMATDLFPNSYTVELQGSDIVAGPIAWISGVEITYNIPEGFKAGSYIYIVNFTDDYGNSKIDSVIFTVDYPTNPIILNAPSDLTVEAGYRGQNLSWKATDNNPNTYIVELVGSGFVVGPTVWISEDPIIYNIPDGLDVGSYIYVVNFTDEDGHFISDSVNFTVEDTTKPTITISSKDIIMALGYTGASLYWVASDAHPGTYTIELKGVGIVAGPTDWASDTNIIFNIPDGIEVGEYYYTVNFTDDYGNSITNTVNLMVVDMTNPIILSSPGDLTLETGYTGVSLSWTATDSYPNNYEIELQGSGVVEGPLIWTSGVPITYNIPDGLAVGTYIYIIIFLDENSNTISDTVTLTINSSSPSEPTVPFGNLFLIFIGLSVVCLIFVNKHQIQRKIRK